MKTKTDKEYRKTLHRTIKNYGSLLKKNPDSMLIKDAIEYVEFLEFCIGSQGKLAKFQHYPKIDADLLFKNRNRKKYEVETVNWTFANQNKTDIDYDSKKPSPNAKEVHRNIYIMNVAQLILFICNNYQVAESIISIKPI